MKAWLLRTCSMVIYLNLCILAGTGLLLELRLEDEPGATVLGLSKEDWSEAHLIIALTFLAVSALHLAVNWSWVTTALKSKGRGAMFATGVIGLVLGVGLLLAPGANNPPNGDRHPSQHPDH